jgi:cellulose biosynthesis protein BcsQ
VISLNYDAIVFDCPPGNEYLERLGVVAADVALVVTNAHPLAVLEPNEFWKFWRAIRIRVGGVQAVGARLIANRCPTLVGQANCTSISFETSAD